MTSRLAIFLGFGRSYARSVQEAEADLDGFCFGGRFWAF